MYKRKKKIAPCTRTQRTLPFFANHFATETLIFVPKTRRPCFGAGQHLYIMQYVYRVAQDSDAITLRTRDEQAWEQI